MALPRITQVQQVIPRAPLADPRGAILAALAPRLAGLAPGARVAITAGSRGIHDYVTILRAAGEAVRAAGGEPVCVPAMGSHAGGTPEGRAAHLARLGVTAEAIGYALADGPSERIGTTEGGVEVFASAAARACDAVIVCNRVKPHSNLVPPLGSGLRKMLAVGLGGPAGAQALHDIGMSDHIVDAAALGRRELNIVAGLAVVEDGEGSLSRVDAVASDDFDAADVELLAAADTLLPRLPFKLLDALFVQRMGKECSGTGMDPNVIGRARRLGAADGEGPGDDVISIGRIGVCSLTPATGGNGLGVGMADVVTQRLADAFDPEVTGLNARTAGFVDGDTIHTIVPTESDVLLALCAGHAPDTIGLALIQDTAHLERYWISEALVDAVEVADHCAVDRSALRPIPFDADGRVALAFDG
jgi:hypothetical protein